MLRDIKFDNDFPEMVSACEQLESFVGIVKSINDMRNDRADFVFGDESCTFFELTLGAKGDTCYITRLMVRKYIEGRIAYL